MLIVQQKCINVNKTVFVFFSNYNCRSYLHDQMVEFATLLCLQPNSNIGPRVN